MKWKYDRRYWKEVKILMSSARCSAAEAPLKLLLLNSLLQRLGLHIKVREMGGRYLHQPFQALLFKFFGAQVLSSQIPQIVSCPRLRVSHKFLHHPQSDILAGHDIIEQFVPAPDLRHCLRDEDPLKLMRLEYTDPERPTANTS